MAGGYTRYWTIALAILLAAGSGSTISRAGELPSVKRPDNEAPSRVLLVGNSRLYYGDSVGNHVRGLASAAGLWRKGPHLFLSATISGAALTDHDVSSTLAAGARLARGPLDYVVLQGSGGAYRTEARRKAFEAAVVAFDRAIRKAGGKTALYMTSGYVKPHRLAGTNALREIEKLYVSVGNKVGVLVIPVGLAFEEAYRQRPGIKLHMEHDGLHPDLPGTYLAACVVYASMFGRSPVGIPYTYHGRIDSDTAAFLQKVAETTVRRFYGPR